MKRMIQMLVCCVLATVLVMGSMANAMAQSMVGEPFILGPGQSQPLRLLPGQTFFTAKFVSSGSTTRVVVNGGQCQNQVIEVPADQPKIQPYDCGPVPSVFFRNMGNSPVYVSAK